ncbi:N-terminal acetyltransferase [Steccherinum ochraceum]|uniref:N-terminal acetyltransferase n=1 Tax=Steccherinum ochraceum TaxID=92696 RepID=A0A4R0RXH6_9APHY|nr:N-terminal acetyltransferase [Steccherinum ochraceum]
MVPVGHLYDSSYIRHVPPLYSPSQVETYLKKIGYDAPLEDVKPNLDTLRAVMVKHILMCPMDNTDLHYTERHHMPVTPQEMYQNMVVGSKGSYCFGQNGLFLGMLRGLGFRAYGGPGRVVVPARSPTPNYPLEYTALHHLVIFVQPHPEPYERVTYLVDVGFGGTGPMRPILFASGEGNAGRQVTKEGDFKGGWEWGTYPPERHRIVPGAFMDSSLESHPGSGKPPLRDWHMQVSHTPGVDASKREWTTLYTFTDKLEFLQWDIDAGSLSVSLMPGAIFHRTIVCLARFPAELDEKYTSGEALDSEELRLVSGSGEGSQKLEWVGKWTLEARRATKRIGGTVLEMKTFRSERERLEVIRDVFGIGVNVEDARWIVGRESELLDEGDTQSKS